MISDIKNESSSSLILEDETFAYEFGRENVPASFEFCLYEDSSDTNSNQEISQVATNIFKQQLQFSIQYYQCTDISRKRITSIISDTLKLLLSTLNKVENQVAVA